VGAVALAAAICSSSILGWINIARHEAELTAYALERCRPFPVCPSLATAIPECLLTRLGVIPLILDGASHFKVASILGHEFGIGVRSGCFCAHPYILHLLELSPRKLGCAQPHAGRRSIQHARLVRASFGLYILLKRLMLW